MSDPSPDCAFLFLSPEELCNTWLNNMHYFPQTSMGIEMACNEYWIQNLEARTQEDVNSRREAGKERADTNSTEVDPPSPTAFTKTLSWKAASPLQLGPVPLPVLSYLLSSNYLPDWSVIRWLLISNVSGKTNANRLFCIMCQSRLVAMVNTVITLIMKCYVNTVS